MITSCGCASFEGITSFLKSHLDTACELIKWCKNLAGENPRIAFSLLRYCIVPKLKYRIETHPTRISKELISAFDNIVLQTAKEILGLPPTPHSNDDIITSPFGLKLRKYSPFLELMHSEANKAPSNDSPNLLPVAYTTADEGVLANHPDIAGRLSLQRSAATGVLSPFPPNDAHPQDVIMILRLLIDRPLIPSGATCFCGRVNTNVGAFTDHLLGCSRIPGQGLTYRHNRIRDALAYTLRTNGIPVSVEPTFYTYEGGVRMRPDITVYGDGPILALDITVAATPVTAAQEKQAKHGDAASREGHLFFPVALSHHGYTDFLTIKKIVNIIFRRQHPESRKLLLYATLKAITEGWITGTAGMMRSIMARSLDNTGAHQQYTTHTREHTGQADPGDDFRSGDPPGPLSRL